MFDSCQNAHNFFGLNEPNSIWKCSGLQMTSQIKRAVLYHFQPLIVIYNTLLIQSCTIIWLINFNWNLSLTYTPLIFGLRIRSLNWYVQWLTEMSTPLDKSNKYFHHKSTTMDNFIWNAENVSLGSWKFITI